MNTETRKALLREASDKVDAALRNAFAKSSSDDYALCAAMTQAAQRAILEMLDAPECEDLPASVRIAP